ncbi:hypothetical protein ABT56_11650 [Photobacterium aquae]|uniref:Uncharacterized protein n=1 Tax=Photobacterium aquae TaxID=1195763 RepID=A0A0J1H0K4_9GAMM|nr:YdbH domain-containing protein [Photobacterium aquae]KLV05368.1 hypothetical protein ABT56_11650 [Photobacterium aquae]
MGKARCFVYGLVFLCGLILIPVILLPPWLASKGIEINAISGVSIGKKIVIGELGITINRNVLTIHQLTLEHFVDKESAISDSSWRLVSPKMSVRLTPIVHHSLKRQGLILSPLELEDVVFNLIDLSPPYVFSAQVGSASMTLASEYHKPKRQQISDVNLVLTTSPFVTLTGVVNHAELNLLFPLDIQGYYFPVNFNLGHFSLSWQPFKTPLAVHLATVNPHWPTLAPDFVQQGKDISLTTDLNRPSTSTRISADVIDLDQPSKLPVFLNQPGDDYDGLHLGQTIASLAQLPFRRLKVSRFTYGQLIIDSRLVLETPRFRMNKPDKPAKLRLKGKALGPDPYLMDVLVKHTKQQDAHFNGTMTGPKGNSLSCEGDINFLSPLPKHLLCNARLRNSADITDRLGLAGMPSAQLKQPLAIEAIQTQLLLRPGSAHLQSNQQANQTNTPKAERKTIHHFRRVESAKYQITLKIPTHIPITLRQLALSHPILASMQSARHNGQAPNDRLDTLIISNDGELQLTASYQTEHFSLSLNGTGEKITLTNETHGSNLELTDTTFSCDFPLLTTDVESRQCQAQSQLHAQINSLSATPQIQLSDIQAKSRLNSLWRPFMARLEMIDTSINIASVLYHRQDLNLQASNVQIGNKRLQLRQHFNNEINPKKGNSDLIVTASQEDPLKIHAAFEAQQLITQAASEKITRNSPVQKYQGLINAELSKIALTLGSQSQATIFQAAYLAAMRVNLNEQRLPSVHAKGQIKTTDNQLAIDGQLTNAKETPLLIFTVKHRQDRPQTDITLHRNLMRFTSDNSLKKHYLPGLPIRYDLTGGEISLDASLRYNSNGWNGTIGLFTHELSGYAHDIHFADLNISVTSAISPEGIRSLHPISLHASYLHAGILLENLYAVLEFDSAKPFYRLLRANAYMLNGSVSTHEVVSNSLLTIPTASLVVHGLSLDALATAIDAKDIMMTGTLDGTLPLSFENGLPVIEQGRLHSRYPGGVLKYRKGSTIDQNIEAASDDSLLVVSKILKNYNYSSLSVHLDYSKKGLLNADASFKGHNPDVLAGRNVNLNISIQEDIPALLKTLSMINASKLESLFLKQMGVDK